MITGPISRWADKKAVAHLHNGILLGHKNEKNKTKQNLPFVAAWMGLENVMPSEISQSEKDKCHIISLLCGSNEQSKVTI